VVQSSCLRVYAGCVQHKEAGVALCGWGRDYCRSVAGNPRLLDSTATNPIDSPPRPGRFYLLVAGCALALYLVSVAPGALWQDGGQFQVRVLQRDLLGCFGLALSHPLYHLVAIAFQILPFGESAFKTNLVSVVFGAVTVANVALLLALATRRLTSALVAAIALAVAHTFWQHCALAETYTLTTALLSTELLCLLQYARTRRAGWLVLLLLVNGVGISNHLIALLSLFCYGTLLIVLAIRRQVAFKSILAAVLCWCVGGGLYWGMVVWQMSGSSDWTAVLRGAFFGDRYAGNVLNTTLGRRELVNTFLYLGLNFPTPLILLVPVGLVWLWRREDRLFVGTLVALLGIHFVWAMRYNVPDQYTFFIPSIVLLAIVMGFGAEWVLVRRPRCKSVLIAAAILPVLVYLPLPYVARAAGLDLGLARQIPFRSEYEYFLHPFKTRDHGPEQFVEYLGSMLPTDAVLIADGTTVRPIHYFQLTGRWRPDLTVYPALDEAGSEGRFPDESELRDALEQGRVYVVTPQPGYCPKWLLDQHNFEPAGHIYRVTGPRMPASVPEIPAP